MSPAKLFQLIMADREHIVISRVSQNLGQSEMPISSQNISIQDIPVFCSIQTMWEKEVERGREREEGQK